MDWVPEAKEDCEGNRDNRGRQETKRVHNFNEVSWYNRLSGLLLWLPQNQSVVGDSRGPRIDYLQREMWLWDKTVSEGRDGINISCLLLKARMPSRVYVFVYVRFFISGKTIRPQKIETRL